MVYLQILCHLILIFAVFETSKINYARVLVYSSFGISVCPGLPLTFASKQRLEVYPTVDILTAVNGR